MPPRLDAGFVGAYFDFRSPKYHANIHSTLLLSILFAFSLLRFVFEDHHCLILTFLTITCTKLYNDRSD